MYKTMIVDDEPFIIEGLKVLIDWELYGFQICGEAGNGMEALDKARRLGIDLIITDISMPELDGLKLIGHCMEQLKDLCKFIVISGYSSFEYARTALSLNVESYILKPVDEEEIVEALIRIKEKLDIENQGKIPKYKEMSKCTGKQYDCMGTEEILPEKFKGSLKLFQENDAGFDPLFEEIELCNKKGIVDKIESIFEKLASGTYSSEIIKGYFSGFQINAGKLLKELYGNDVKEQSFFENLKPDVMDLDEVRKEFIHSCIRIAEYISSHRDNKKDGLIHEVKRIIDDNYNNKDISLKMLAQRFQINPVYLGQLFSKNFMTSFNDYLNRSRINRALDYLSDEKLKMGSIAELVGYNDFNYFICKFKEITNTTPIKYRESLRKCERDSA